MKRVQPMEVSVTEASASAAAAAAQLLALAQDAHGPEPEDPVTRKIWRADARTHTCHTHIAIAGVSPNAFVPLVDFFYHQAQLTHQPWYEEFLGGEALPCTEPPAAGTLRQQLALGRFDLGVGTPRCYRQLVSLHGPQYDTRVIVARSVDEGPAIPDDTVLAYTLDANGEVLQWRDGTLHWHHICTTPGARVLPGALDRWLINALRLYGLDRSERDTYRREALALSHWIHSSTFEQDVDVLYKELSG